MRSSLAASARALASAQPPGCGALLATPCQQRPCAMHASSSCARQLSGSTATSSGQPSTSGRDAGTPQRAWARGSVRLGASKRAAAAPTVPVVESLPDWELPLRVVRYPDPRLRAVNARIACFDERLRQLAAAMFDVMYTDDGVGLAAPQVGLNVRLMVFNETAKRGDAAETVLVNPEIVERSKASEVDEEGCLSFPAVFADVERATKIEVRFQDLAGQLREMTLRGFEARVFQHEYDHLQGVLFHDRMRPAELERVRPALVRLEDAFVAANPGVKVQRVAPLGLSKGAGKGFGAVRR